MTAQPTTVRPGRHRVVSPATARTMRRMLQQCGREGHRAPGGHPRIRGGGKDGNVREARGHGLQQAGERRQLRRAWPRLTTPALVVAVVVEAPSYAFRSGGLSAAPVFAEVMEKALHHLGVPSDGELSPIRLSELAAMVGGTVVPLCGRRRRRPRGAPRSSTTAARRHAGSVFVAIPGFSSDGHDFRRQQPLPAGRWRWRWSVPSRCRCPSSWSFGARRPRPDGGGAGREPFAAAARGRGHRNQRQDDGDLSARSIATAPREDGAGSSGPPAPGSWVAPVKLERTTPRPTTCSVSSVDMVDAGVEIAPLEVSSHALSWEGWRAPGSRWWPSPTSVRTTLTSTATWTATSRPRRASSNRAGPVVPSSGWTTRRAPGGGVDHASR